MKHRRLCKKHYDGIVIESLVFFLSPASRHEDLGCERFELVDSILLPVSWSGPRSLTVPTVAFFRKKLRLKPDFLRKADCRMTTTVLFNSAEWYRAGFTRSATGCLWSFNCFYSVKPSRNIRAFLALLRRDVFWYVFNLFGMTYCAAFLLKLDRINEKHFFLRALACLLCF